MTDSITPPPVETSARYVQLQFHAAGGLGEVYRASDAVLRRDVAIKFIQPRHLGNEDYMALFELEAEITSRLDHPGVVPVYAVGETADKRPFYAMRYIEGMPLREAIHRYHQAGTPQLELHRLLTHLVTVCNTVAYAHNRGIVHCDIKPENIMLGKYGETLLVDWGLATTVERDERAKASGERTMRLTTNDGSSKSSSGSAAGTVGYMSPEQHPGFMKTISPGSDIYSLGATLYCLLTNQAPLQGAEETLLLDKLRWGEFPPPSVVNPKVPRALEAICLKAMATHRAERYTSALDLAADLEAWLADETVSVYRERFFERAVRWARRNRNWVVSGLLAGLFVLGISAFSAVRLNDTAEQERQARIEAEAARQAAEKARTEAVTAQQNGMRLAARFAARAVADEIEMRWRFLLQAAADPELAPMMQAFEEHKAHTPEHRALQTWITRRHQSQTPDVDSWFLTDAQGVQIARDPYNETSIFQNYAERSYFKPSVDNENTSAAVAQDPSVPPHIISPHISNPFVSTATNTLKVAFTVPVWSDPQTQTGFLGVLGMTVELGAFYELQTSLDAGQIAVLVDTREDDLLGHPERGLILYHPHGPSVKKSDARSMPRLPPALVERLLTLRKRVNQQGGTQNIADALELEYHDPLLPADAPAALAVFEPVRVKSGASTERDTGWIVIVQETPAAAP